MSQSDLNIANVSRSLFRQEVNKALQALGSLSSGATEPTTTYAYQLWADTGSGLLKQRNAANDGWINKGNLADVDWGFLNKAGGSMSGLIQLDQSSNIVAAATTNLGTATGNAVTVTHASGTLAITSFGGASLQSGTELTITWSVSGGSLSATYNATSLILPSAANLTIADGDVWKVQKISDSNSHWRVIDITKANGKPISTSVGVGCVIYTAMNTAPTGYLKANGADVSRATYSDLFAAIGTTFGAGDGVTTFNLPDLRGEFIRGWDDGKGTDSGRVFGSSQLDSFQGHRHTLTDAGGTAVTIATATNAGSGGTGKYTLAGTPNNLARDEVNNGTNGVPRTSSETRPRNVALLACIKF